MFTNKYGMMMTVTRFNLFNSSMWMYVDLIRESEASRWCYDRYLHLWGKSLKSAMGIWKQLTVDGNE